MLYTRKGGVILGTVFLFALSFVSFYTGSIMILHDMTGDLIVTIQLHLMVIETHIYMDEMKGTDNIITTLNKEYKSYKRFIKIYNVLDKLLPSFLFNKDANKAIKNDGGKIGEFVTKINQKVGDS